MPHSCQYRRSITMSFLRPLARVRETDDLVERSTLQHITGYYVTVDELDRQGNIKQMRKWITGNAHAGMKWLAARRPKVYREQRDVHHSLNMDEAFLRFLDQMDEEQKLLKSQRASSAKLIGNQAAPDVSSDARARLMIEIQQFRDKEPSDG
jgi:hypothetical protein